MPISHSFAALPAVARGGQLDEHSAAGDDLPLRAAMIGLRRRKWVILATLVAGIALAVSIWALTAPRYTATASVLVEPREVRLFEEPGRRANDDRTDDHLADNQLKVLGSRSIIEQAIAGLGLAEDPEFNPKLERSRSGGWVGSLRQAAFGSSRDGASLPDAEREAVFDRLLRKLKLGRDGQSNALTVSVTSTDPEKAARIANAIADKYTSGSLRSKQDVIDRAQRSLEQQLAQLRSQAEEADRAVQHYRAEHQLTDTINDPLAAQELSHLKSDLVAAQADRVAKETRVREIRGLRASGQSYKPVTEIASSPIVAELLQRQDEVLRRQAQLTTIYGDKHPAVQQAEAEAQSIAKKLNQEIDNIVRNFQSEALFAAARERALRQAIDDATRQFAADGNASVDLRQLEREAQSKRSVYEQTLLRLQQIDAEMAVLQPDARLISAAVAPDRPSFPRLGTLLAVSGIVSVVLGAIFAAILEYLDRGLRSGRQVECVLGVPALGLTPRIPDIRRGGAVSQYVLEKPLSAYADAVKAMFIRLHRSATVPPKVLLVTSSYPGEGKTTLALSFAALLSGASRKTLFVDLDLRKPGSPRAAWGGADCGLSEVMQGERSLNEAIQSHPKEPKLHILPAGRMPRSVNLLDSRAIVDLVTELRSQYEYIILDSPPVLGFSDASLAAAASDAVLFVIQWEKTSESVAASGLDALMKVGAPVIGVALTQVDLRRHRKYGYGDVGQYYGKYKAAYQK